MGIYDEQIRITKRSIEAKRDEIRKYRANISELESILDKCNIITSKMSEVIGNIFSNIDKKGADIRGNFVSYYKDNLNRITKEKNIYSVNDETANDKIQIKKRIISYEDRIESLQNEIYYLESDLTYYQNNNVEAGGDTE